MRNQINSLLALLITNFFTVLDDNLLKALISLVSAYWNANLKPSSVVTLAAACMVLPFILFSPLAGFVSKKVHHKNTVVKLKLLEVLLMFIAFYGFFIESVAIVMIAMFLMGLQSTFFSPLKFSLVRDIGGIEKSSVGVGALEMTTFLGVLTGTFLAGILADQINENFLLLPLTFMFTSIMGLINALFINAPENKPMKVRIVPYNFLKYIIRKYVWASKFSPGLNSIVLALSMFWMIASLIQMNLFIHCPQTLKMSGTETGITLALVAVFIGLGSFISGKISGKRVLLILTPLGSIFFISSLLVIANISSNVLLFQILMIITAFFGGFLKTPLNAWMQVNVKGRLLGEAIAYNNLMNFVFILLSALIFGFIEPRASTNIVFLVVAFISFILLMHVGIAFKNEIFPFKIKK